MSAELAKWNVCSLLWNKGQILVFFPIIIFMSDLTKGQVLNNSFKTPKSKLKGGINMKDCLIYTYQISIMVKPGLINPCTYFLTWETKQKAIKFNTTSRHLCQLLLFKRIDFQLSSAFVIREVSSSHHQDIK